MHLTPRRRAATVLAVLALLSLLPTLPAVAQVGDVSVLAHRGASASAPEHTFFAYDLAVEQDTDFLECDLQLTADGVLVCVHDSTVDRTSDGTGEVEQLTLADLRTLDWGSWFGGDEVFTGAQVVPFEEQLDCYLAVNPRMRFHVETKSPDSLGGAMEAELARVLQQRGLLPADRLDPQTAPVIIQSFSRQSLEIIREVARTLTTALLFAAPDQANVTLTEAIAGTLPDVADVMAPNAAFLAAHPFYVDQVHANGGEVHTWTVDDPDQMDRLLAQGVDGIFTNVPDVARERIDAAGTAVPAAQRGNPDVVDPLCPGVAGTVEGDAIAQALRFAGLTFAGHGPADIAARGPHAYAPEVLLATDATFADALAAGGAQGLGEMPLLLTGPDALDGRVRAELVRLGTRRVTILGGAAAVGEAVEQALVDAGLEVARLAGDERITTALAVADAVAPDATTAVLTRADGPGTAAFVDALGAGALAAGSGAPVLLTATDVLSPATAAWLEASAVQQVTIAGGTSAVGEDVAEAIRGMGIDVRRAGGPTRYETAVALPDLAGEVDRVVLVDGTAADGWAAGFTAASAAIGGGTVVLPVAGDTVPDPVADVLDRTGVDVVCALGVTVDACRG